MTAKPPAKTTTKNVGLLSALKTFWVDPRLVPMLNYFLLFCMVASAGLLGVVALLVAFYREDKAPDWLKGHYVFQARTFWAGIVPILATFFLTAFAQKHGLSAVPGVRYSLIALLIVCLAWTAGRAVLGFNHLFYNRPMPNPKAWLI